MNDSMTPADVMALTNRNNDGMFGGSGACRTSRPRTRP